MLSIDLFDSRFEKRLHEGAVDDAEYARLKKLGEKIDYLKQARAKATDPEMRRVIDGRIKQYDDERREIMSVRGMKEAEQSQPPTAKGLLKGKDLVTPQQRVTGATPPQKSVLGKARETLGSFANWLAGKDDTGPTYEGELKENDPNSAINAAKFAYEQIRKAHDTNVDTATIRWMGNSEPVTMSRNQLYHTVQKLKAMSRQNRNAFAVQTLADRNNFNLWLGSQKKVMPRPPLKQPTDPFQPELPLGKPKIGPVQERTQKKKSDDIQAGDVKVARELQKLRAQYPAARSDVEAVARAEIDSSERSNQQITAIRGANERQDALLRQLVALDREQGREIDSLDLENNNLEQQLAQIQATNNRLQQTIGQMTGTKKSSRPDKFTVAQSPTAATTATTVPASVDIDPGTAKKLQDLESQISQLQARPSTPDVQKKIDDLQTRINALPARAAQALNIDKDKKSTSKVPRPQAPAGDLDIEPIKKQPVKRKTTKSKTKTTKNKVSPSADTTPDNLDILDLEEPDMFAVNEHGGGIGPRQHWQSMMRNEGWSDRYNPTPYAVYIDGRQWKVFSTDEQARIVADKVRVNLKLQGRDQTVTIAPSQEYSQKKITEEDLVESIKDTASATAVIACLLTGGSLTGCATAPQQTTAQQVLKTGQDVGRTVQTAKKITRAGAEAEVNQEIRNLLRGIGGRPEELNNSNIIRIWKRIKGQPPVTPEPQAPEYGPAEPVKRPATFEAKEPTNQQEYFAIVDRLHKEIDMEQNRAVRQMLMSQLAMLEKRAQAAGWIPKKELREDTAALAAEDAILKRIFVKHKDLMMEYGPDKITQAAEEVSYNVGDIAHITEEQVNEWVRQVEYILGARP